MSTGSSANFTVLSATAGEGVTWQPARTNKAMDARIARMEPPAQELLGGGLGRGRGARGERGRDQDEENGDAVHESSHHRAGTDGLAVAAHRVGNLHVRAFVPEHDSRQRIVPHARDYAHATQLV